MEGNYVPDRKFTGPLMRSKYDLETFSKEYNLLLDSFFYLMDGERDLITLCVLSGISWEAGNKMLKKLTDENLVFDNGKKPEQKIKE